MAIMSRIWLDAPNPECNTFLAGFTVVALLVPLTAVGMQSLPDEVPVGSLD